MASIDVQREGGAIDYLNPPQYATRRPLPAWQNPTPNTGIAGTGQTPAAPASSYQDILRGINPQNWQAGLAQNADALRAFGVNPQQASDGSYRGRLYGSMFPGGYYDPFSDYGWQTQGSGGGGGGVFSDPATQEWEKLLRTLNDRLQTPQPTLTDQQRAILATQATEPLTRARDAETQRVKERMAARGIAPTSGIFEQALQDVDRQFAQLQTGQQTNFAIDEINREQNQFNTNEQRALAGLNLFKQIPQLADQRLASANAMLMPANPYQLLTLQNQIANQAQQNTMYQDAQNQQFWQWLGQALAGLF